MKVETIAKLAPLTATKCVRPDLRISFLKLWLCSEVSPRTIPGISAPESPVPLALRKPSLIASSALAQREACDNSVISPLPIRRAATLPSLLANALTRRAIF